MLEESNGQDHFLQMIDNLQILNLNIDGAAILKSMADAIRCALEKGLLLEQIIVNQQNNAIENSNLKTPKKPKKNKQKSLCLDDSGVSQSDDVSQNKTSTEQEHTSPKTRIQKLNSCKPKSDLEVQKELGLPNCELIINANNTSRSCIKLVDQSCLIKTSLSSSCIQNQLPDEALTNTDQHNFAPSINDQSNQFNCNEIRDLQQLPQHKNDQFSQVNDFMNSVHQNNLFLSSESVTSDKLAIKNEYTDGEENNQLISSIKSDSGRAANMSLPHKEPPVPTFEQPVMPSPIIIKLEPNKQLDYTHKPPEEFVPFNLTLNITDPNEQMKISPSENNSEVIQGCVEESGDLNNPQVLQANENKIFLEAGKDATEGEVRAVFKDLDIVFIRIINRPTFAFGFVTFSTAEQMKTALSLTMQFAVGGKSMLIRPFKQNRNRNERVMKESTQPQHPHKRPSSSSPSKENYKIQKTDDRFKTDNRNNMCRRNHNDLNASSSNNDKKPSSSTYSNSKNNQSKFRDQEKRPQCRTTDHENDNHQHDIPHENYFGTRRHNSSNHPSENFVSRNKQNNFHTRGRRAQQRRPINRIVVKNQRHSR